MNSVSKSISKSFVPGLYAVYLHHVFYSLRRYYNSGTDRDADRLFTQYIGTVINSSLDDRGLGSTKTFRISIRSVAVEYHKLYAQLNNSTRKIIYGEYKQGTQKKENGYMRIPLCGEILELYGEYQLQWNFTRVLEVKKKKREIRGYQLNTTITTIIHITKYESKQVSIQIQQIDNTILMKITNPVRTVNCTHFSHTLYADFDGSTVWYFLS